MGKENWKTATNPGMDSHSLLQRIFPTRVERWSPALQAGSLTSEPPRQALLSQYRRQPKRNPHSCHYLKSNTVSEQLRSHWYSKTEGWVTQPKATHSKTCGHPQKRLTYNTPCTVTHGVAESHPSVHTAAGHLPLPTRSHWRHLRSDRVTSHRPPHTSHAEQVARTGHGPQAQLTEEGLALGCQTRPRLRSC